MAARLKYPTNELRDYHRAQNRRRNYRDALARAAARTSLLAPAPTTLSTPPVPLLSSNAQAAPAPRKKRGRPRKNGGAPSQIGNQTSCINAPAPSENTSNNIPQPNTAKSPSPPAPITQLETPHPCHQLSIPELSEQHKREHRNAYQRHWRDQRKKKMLAIDPTARPYGRPLKTKSSLASRQSQFAKALTSFYRSQSRVWQTLMRAAATWLPTLSSQTVNPVDQG